jgi:hypothetical protein
MRRALWDKLWRRENMDTRRPRAFHCSSPLPPPSDRLPPVMQAASIDVIQTLSFMDAMLFAL